MTQENVNKTVLLAVVLVISLIFLSMIRSFAMVIFLAGLFSALIHPVYRKILQWVHNRRALASISTIILIVLFIVLPLGFLMGVVTAQAIKVGNAAKPWVQAQISQPDKLFSLLEALPFYEQVVPYRQLILEKAGELVGVLSGFLIENLNSAALGTANFLFMISVLLYTMFFFLMDGHILISKMLYYLPLEDEAEQRMLEKFTSVAKATLKGTAVIGTLQGSLAGLAFSVAGIPSPVFWGVIMVMLSVLPGIGTALIWAPASVILLTTGHVAKGLGLLLFCGLVVGSIDNILRPILVGKDTQMHELLIFFGTLGGILMFGFVGFIIGPIIAALFITIWDIYGMAFSDILPYTTAAGTEEFETPAIKEDEPSADDDDPPETLFY